MVTASRGQHWPQRGPEDPRARPAHSRTRSQSSRGLGGLSPRALIEDVVVHLPCANDGAEPSQTNADYARFLNIAEASLAETEYLLLLALDLGYLSNEPHPPIAAEIDEVARMLYALRVKVEQGDP